MSEKRERKKDRARRIEPLSRPFARPLRRLPARLALPSKPHTSSSGRLWACSFLQGFNHLAIQSDARRGLASDSHATPPSSSRLPKAVPNVVSPPSRLCAPPPPSPFCPQPRWRVLPSQPEVQPPSAATAATDTKDDERASRLHRPREKIASLRFKRYEW